MAKTRPLSGGSPSQRQLRVGEVIRRALSEILARGELHDEALAHVSVTVAEVRVSPDLRHATAFVLPLGGGAVDAMVKALARAAPFLRGEVARAINLRYAPEIVFAPDTSFDHASRIDAALRRPEVRRDLHPDAKSKDEPD